MQAGVYTPSGPSDGQQAGLQRWAAPVMEGRAALHHQTPPALPPSPLSFVVWLRQTSGFAGRFLNGPWK